MRAGVADLPLAHRAYGPEGGPFAFGELEEGSCKSYQNCFICPVTRFGPLIMARRHSHKARRAEPLFPDRHPPGMARRQPRRTDLPIREKIANSALSVSRATLSAVAGERVVSLHSKIPNPP